MKSTQGASSYSATPCYTKTACSIASKTSESTKILPKCQAVSSGLGTKRARGKTTINTDNLMTAGKTKRYSLRIRPPPTLAEKLNYLGHVGDETSAEEECGKDMTESYSCINEFSLDESLDDDMSQKMKAKEKNNCCPRDLNRNISPSKNQSGEEEISEAEDFDLHQYPQFLFEPNVKECPEYQKEKYALFVQEFRTWWLNADLVSNHKSSTNTIQAYISELCRFSDWIEQSMARSNINWQLNDLLAINNIKGDDFNTRDGPKFLVDPTDYMTERNLSISRKYKLACALVKVMEFLNFKLSPGNQFSNLGISESANRRVAIDSFSSVLRKLMSKFQTSTIATQQEKRIAVEKHEGMEMSAEYVRKILSIWLFSNHRHMIYEKIANFSTWLQEYCQVNDFPELKVDSASLGLDEWSMKELNRLQNSKRMVQESTEIRDLLNLELLGVGICHR